MSRWLWLLLGLQLRGWVRNVVRSLGTVKGALLAAVGLGVFLLWFSYLILATAGPQDRSEQIRIWGPAGLLLYCVLNVLSTPAEKAIYFSPGEVNFLFPAPFGRRELLAYKLMLGFLFSLPTTLFMTFVLHIYAFSFLSAFVGLLLTYQFMQLFANAVNLLASTGGGRALALLRAAVVAAAAALALGVAWQAGLLGGAAGDLGDVARRAVETDIWKTVSRPLQYFFEAFLSREPWPELAWNAALALAVDAALLVVVFGLDAHYLEASAAASARIYARLRRMRRLGPAGGGRAMALVTLPMAPWWGGVGPTFWRQLTTATRGPGRLLVAAVVFGLTMTATWTGLEGQGAIDPVFKLIIVVGFGGLMMTFLTTLAPFDFRGDVDQMAFLKTLPTPPWRLALGEVLAPALVFTLIQWAALGAMMTASGRADGLLLLVAVFAPLYNFVLFGLDNLLFLLFPTRVMVTTPGDFQAMGRNVLAQFTKTLGVGAAVFVATVCGVVVYLLSGRNVLAAAAAAWLAAAACAAALVPLVGWAFTFYDVARDAPP